MMIVYNVYKSIYLIGKLKFNLTFLILLNKTWTVPFNNSSYISDMITFNHLSDKIKSRLHKNIIYLMAFLKNYQKNSFTTVSDKK